jgi:ABC-type polysaccharide/polyol phosphate transport system ATPase subunit
MIDKNIERVVVKDLSKEFCVELRTPKKALEKFVSFFSGKKDEKIIKALSKVSFSVKAGKNLGVIGKNASGKSTLLRNVAGIYSADEGKISIHGRLLYLTSFGQGLKPQLTMRENIYLLGAIMGLSQRDIKERFEEIVEFSGLKNFVDMRVKKFSTGMVARLNFAIGIYCMKHHNPDILLLDEVFISGGDFNFRVKAINKIEELIMGGASVIIVSHDFNLIKKYCDEVIWLENGKIMRQGDPTKVVEAYLDSLKSMKDSV